MHYVCTTSRERSSTTRVHTTRTCSMYKLCKVEGCITRAQVFGLCFKHGGDNRPVCSVLGCSSRTQSRGLCSRHGGLIRQLCSVRGCVTPCAALGLCIKHGGYRICTVPSCSTPARAFGLCHKHRRTTPVCSRKGCTNPLEDSVTTCWTHTWYGTYLIPCKDDPGSPEHIHNL